MYIKKRKQVDKQKLYDYLAKYYGGSLLKKRAKDCYYDNPDDLLVKTVDELYKLNEALVNDYEVYAECEKEPPGNLDTGYHWFQIWYLTIINGNPERHIFFAPLVMDINKSKHCRKYGFSSGAIGMSRQLDATDHIFRMLERCDGTYAQL